MLFVQAQAQTRSWATLYAELGKRKTTLKHRRRFSNFQNI